MTKQEIIQVANEIKASFNKEVIKDIEFPPLVSRRTLEDCGVGVIFQLSTKFDYDEATIMEWKNKLGADDWYINVNRNQLRLHYLINF
jgi:hypothetical protein